MTTKTTPDLAALRRLAEAATPGEWAIEIEQMARGGEAIRVVQSETGRVVAPAERVDADHIAAFDPPTAKYLLDRIAELEQAASALLMRVPWQQFSPEAADLYRALRTTEGEDEARAALEAKP